MLVSGLKGGLGVADRTPVAAVLAKNAQLHLIVVKNRDMLTAVLQKFCCIHSGSSSIVIWTLLVTKQEVLPEQALYLYRHKKQEHSAHTVRNGSGHCKK